MFRCQSAGNRDVKDTSDLVGPVGALFGHSGSISAQALVAKLSDVRTRSAAVRYLLGYVIVQRLQPGPGVEDTFLPEDLSKAYQSIAESAQRSEGEHARSLVIIR